MHLVNNEYCKKLNITDKLKKEEELFENLIIKENLLTFKGWVSELRKIDIDKRLDIVGIFDFETTHMNGRAISMSIIRYSLSMRKVLSEDYWEFKNPVSIDPESFKVHGLSEEHLADKPSFLESYNLEIKEKILTSDCLIAHRSSYDISTLGRELYSYGIKADYKLRAMDSIPLLRAEMKEKSYSIPFCTEFFNVNLEGMDEGLSTSFHNALYDCRALLGIIKKAIVIGNNDKRKKTINNTYTLLNKYNPVYIRKIKHKKRKRILIKGIILLNKHRKALAV